MKKAIGYGLEVCGFGGMAYAAYLVTPGFGCALGGLFLVLIGLGLGARG